MNVGNSKGCRPIHSRVTVNVHVSAVWLSQSLIHKCLKLRIKVPKNFGLFGIFGTHTCVPGSQMTFCPQWAGGFVGTVRNVRHRVYTHKSGSHMSAGTKKNTIKHTTDWVVYRSTASSTVRGNNRLYLGHVIIPRQPLPIRFFVIKTDPKSI